MPTLRFCHSLSVQVARSGLVIYGYGKNLVNGTNRVGVTYVLKAVRNFHSSRGVSGL